MALPAGWAPRLAASLQPGSSRNCSSQRTGVVRGAAGPAAPALKMCNDKRGGKSRENEGDAAAPGPKCEAGVDSLQEQRVNAPTVQDP